MFTRPRPRTLIFALFVVALFSAACDEETCADCRDEKCSDVLAYCTDADCACMSGCMGDGGIPAVQGCLSSCGLEQRPANFIPVEECAAVACPDSEDECSTPAGYAPPEPVTGGPTGDIAGGDLPDCAFDESLAFAPDGPVLQLASADGTVCVKLERVNNGAGSLANTNWGLLDIWVGPLGGVAHVENPSDLCYYSSHHNFADFAHVWTGRKRHSLKLAEDGHGGARAYVLTTFEGGPLDGAACPPLAEGSEQAGSPVELFGVGQ